MSASQPSFFPYLNPLLDRLGPDFFKTAPTQPGVYLFRSANGEILYVGKAKNLKNRLASYKNARPSTVSRKVIRLLRLTHSIETRVCESEIAALLTENRLLRQCRPPMNVVNTRPETYYFIGLEPRFQGALARFRLTSNPNVLVESEGRLQLFGVFKGRRRTREAFQALLRLLAALDANADGFSYPMALIRRKTPYHYASPLPEELERPLKDFLAGNSRGFLVRLIETLLGNEHIPKFVHHVINEDLKILSEFYVYGPRRVRVLRRVHGIKKRLIAQDEIDDLLVLSLGAGSDGGIASAKS